MYTLNKYLTNKKGSAYMELAILLPLLLFLIFGILEAGFVATTDNALVSAVDYGIRSVAVNGGMNETVFTRLQNQLALRGINPAKARITTTWAPVQFNEEVYLRIEYPYSFRLLGPLTDPLRFDLTLSSDSYAISERNYR